MGKHKYDYDELVAAVWAIAGDNDLEQAQAPLRELLEQQLSWAWNRGRNIGRLDARPGVNKVENPYSVNSQVAVREVRTGSVERDALLGILSAVTEAEYGGDVLGTVESLARIGLEAGA